MTGANRSWDPIDVVWNAAKSQREFYDAFADEFDDAWHRTSRFERRDAENREWLGEVSLARRWVSDRCHAPTILELASGSGKWTGILAMNCKRVIALDSSMKMLKINRSRNSSYKNIAWVCADALSDPPLNGRIDAIFLSLWISHVPRMALPHFMQMLSEVLHPGGRVFVLDSLFDASRTAVDESLVTTLHPEVIHRRTADGDVFPIVKNFYTPVSLLDLVGSLGWTGRASSFGRYFFCAEMSPPTPHLEAGEGPSQ